MREKIWNLIGFNLGWFACVLFAAADRPLLGPVVMGAFLAVHFLRAARPGPEVALVLVAGVLGTGLDSVLLALGVISFESGLLVPIVAPLWMTCLWMGFATLFGLSLVWLRGRYALAAAFGLVGGPLAYYGGARLGALALADTPWALVAIGIEYAIAIPLLLLVASRFEQPAASRAPRIVSVISRLSGERGGRG